MRKTVKKTNYYLNLVSGILLAIMMFMTVIDVVVRKMLGQFFSGSYELTLLLLTMIVFLGFGYANDFKEHVVIDVLYEALPRTGKRVFSIIASLLNLTIVSVMCFVVFKQAFRLYASGAYTSSLRIPHWPFAILGAVGLLGFILSILGDFILIFKEGRVLSNDAD
jgi:TRAP-type C4-dicarboxylate transport system permease small subunit